MNYPILSLPLTDGTRWIEDPHVGETRTEPAALRYWRGQSSPIANNSGDGTDTDVTTKTLRIY